MVSTPAPRAAIYVRISRDKTGAGLGVERQEADCRALAQRLEVDIATVRVDNDLSAYSGKPRPAYRQLLDDIRGGHVDVVLCWHTDRLHRSPVELEEWIDACQPRGVEVHTVKAGPIDLATPSGRMVARQLGAVARYESEHRSERVAAKMEQIARSGGYLGGPRPFGYRDGGMELEPAEAKLVADGARLILAGRSLRSIVKMWNDAGAVTTRKGQPWEPQTVRDTLMRSRNAGLVTHRGQVIGPAQWEPIISEDEWRGVCAILNDPGRRTTPGNQPRWLGSLIYRCGVCGSSMTVGTSGAIRKPCYRCRAHDRGGPRHVTRGAEALDEFVSAVIVARLSQPDAVDLFATTHVDVDTDVLRGELAGIDEQRTELGSRLGRGEITLAMLDAANEPLLHRRTAIERQLADTTVSSPIVDVVTSDDVAQAWAALPLDSRRSILNELMTVTLLPTRPGRRRGGEYFDPEAVTITPKVG